MPTVSFNLTVAQATRIQQATDRYNAANETNLTTKQWALRQIKRGVVESQRTEESTRASDAINVALAALNTDLAGEA